MSNKNLDIFIVDDEKMIHESLEFMIRKYCHHVRVVEKCFSIKELISALKLYTPDAILLDVQMPQFSGIDFLNMNGGKYEIIFITAHRKYALPALKGQAFDYLLKPVKIDELIDTFEKLRAKLGYAKPKKRENTDPTDTFCISYSKGRKIVSLIDIIHINSESNYSRYYFADGSKLLVAKTLRQIEKELPDDIFCRCHNSHIVNMRWVKSFDRRNRDSFIQLRSNTELKVSRTKRDLVLSLLEKLHNN